MRWLGSSAAGTWWPEREKPGGDHRRASEKRCEGRATGTFAPAVELEEAAGEELG